jgi:hypothetical protein
MRDHLLLANAMSVGLSVCLHGILDVLAIGLRIYEVRTTEIETDAKTTPT